MLNKLLSAAGYRQTWHVCWVANIPGKMPIYGDGVYAFRPRLTSNSVEDLRMEIAEDTGAAIGCKLMPEQISITGLARIGG